MLIGQYKAVINLKRRVAIPSKFRKELGENPIISRWYEGCLVIVSRESWKALLERLTGARSKVTEPVRDTDRFILGSAYELEPDWQGRVVIPKSLAEYTNLKDETTFLGLGDRVEVWNRASWDTREKLIAKKAGELIEKISKDEKGR